MCFICSGHSWDFFIQHGVSFYHCINTAVGSFARWSHLSLYIGDGLARLYRVVARFHVSLDAAGAVY